MKVRPKPAPTEFEITVTYSQAIYLKALMERNRGDGYWDSTARNFFANLSDELSKYT